MTTKEAYAHGYLRRMAGYGLRPAHLETYLTKQADPLSAAASAVTGGITGLLGSAGHLAVLAALGLPVAVGIGTGYAHSAFNDTDDEDVKREQLRDLIRAHKAKTLDVRGRINSRKERNA